MRAATILALLAGLLVAAQAANNPLQPTVNKAQQGSTGFALIPAGKFEMGDHHNFVDPRHPSDEVPTHTVRLDGSMWASTTSPRSSIASSSIRLSRSG